MLKIIEKLLIKSIRTYRKHISPLITQNCRYYPTCSHYSEQAILKYGPIKGMLLSAKRILRCNQFFKGGFDPLV